jgi:hypothetical protein
MVSHKELKSIAHSRIKSAKILIDGGDWDGAAQMLGLALECALKAAVCKNLRIQNYPESHKDKKVPEFFMTHAFIRLLLLSGLSDIFTAAGDALAFANWSNFTIQYPGEWTSMRYDSGRKFDETTVRGLYINLFADTNSIIKTIAKKKRW